MPCPLCGGLIHPVAGRCKHCKEDLTSFRAGRPQAAAALPALNGTPAASTNGTNGHAVAAITAAPVPVVVAAREGSQPILPPRTTARSMAAARPHSLWRSWPMLVIVLAVIAIVAATVIMIIPPGGKKHDGKMSAPPAPERMETNPLPEKSSQLDPWDKSQGAGPGTGGPNAGGVPGGTLPMPAPQPAQPQAPAPADPDDDDWVGSGGVMGGITGGGLLGGTGASPFLFSMLDHACKKLKSCPDVDQSPVAAVCAGFPSPPSGTPSPCAAAQKCLDAIDHMSCSQAQDATSPVAVYAMFQDCVDAMNC